jgi:hypothetical protein
VAPLEPWEKVLVDIGLFQPTVHGQITCVECHGGVQTEGKDAAHEGLIAVPVKTRKLFVAIVILM